MANTLVVTIKNICLYVLGNGAAEGWLIDDHRHEPKLVLDDGTMTIPKQHAGRKQMHLGGCVVAFGTDDKLFGAAPSRLPMGPTASGGKYRQHCRHCSPRPS